MRQRLATAALFLAWLCANGAVWDALQVAAWSKMFAGYSATMSVTQALQETFDPAKPCEMCVGIVKAKGESGSEPLPITELQQAAKFVLVFHSVDAPVFANDPGDWLPAPLARQTERTDPVPLQPPRA